MARVVMANVVMACQLLVDALDRALSNKRRHGPYGYGPYSPYSYGPYSYGP